MGSKSSKKSRHTDTINTKQESSKNVITGQTVEVGTTLVYFNKEILAWSVGYIIKITGDSLYILDKYIGECLEYNINSKALNFNNDPINKDEAHIIKFKSVYRKSNRLLMVGDSDLAFWRYVIDDNYTINHIKGEIFGSIKFNYKIMNPGKIFIDKKVKF